MNMEELIPLNYVPIMVSGKASNKIEGKTPKAKPLSSLHQNCCDGLSGLDFKRPQEEDLRQILYPDELLKKVHIKGSLLYIW